MLDAAHVAARARPHVATNRRAQVLQFPAGAAVLVVVERATHHGAVSVKDE
jgi:hypothetical protein